MKKQQTRKKLLLPKTRTAQRSCWVKKGRTNAWWENFTTNRVPESIKCHESFYELSDMLRPYLEKKCTHLRTPISVEVQVGSFLH